MHYCTNCDFEQGDGGTWGTREYILGSGVRIPVSWRIGWCESCNGLAAIENLSIKSRIKNYREAQRDLQCEVSSSSLSWLLGFSKSEKALQRSYEDKLADAIDAIEMLASRKSPPHCLKCLSTQVHVPTKRASDFDDAPSSPCVYSSSEPVPEKADSANNEGKQSDYVLLHPGCGGEILPRPFDINGLRLALKQSVHRFTSEGLLIDKEYVSGYSAPDHEYWEALSQSNRRIRKSNLSIKDDENFFDIPKFLRKCAD
jgi:hypothetical protein